MTLIATARGTARTLAFSGYAAATLGAFTWQARGADDARVEALLSRYRRRLFRGTLRLYGIDVEVSGVVAPTRRARLVVANHQSAFDIAVLGAYFGGSFVSRADVERWPVLGQLAADAHTLFVDREDRASGAQAIRTMRRRLRDGQTITVFPEGHTARGDVVDPFQPGSFAAARGLDAEIVPVGIAYAPATEYIEASLLGHLVEVGGRGHTRVALAVGPSLGTSESAERLAEAAHEAVQRAFHSARRALADRAAARADTNDPQRIHRR